MSYITERRGEEKERRRAEILDAAEALYAKTGWDALTVDQVARRVALLPDRPRLATVQALRLRARRQHSNNCSIVRRPVRPMVPATVRRPTAPRWATFCRTS